MQFNIMLVGRLDVAGFYGTWGNGRMTIEKDGTHFFTAKMENYLYNAPVLGDIP